MKLKSMATIFAAGVLALSVTVSYGQIRGGQRVRDRLQNRPKLADRLNQGREKSIERVRQILNLTEAQVASLRSLLDERRQAVQAVSQHARAKREALRNLTAQPNPNPTEIGNAVLALRQVREPIRQAQTNFQTGFENLLTPDQNDKLNTLKSAGRARGPLSRWRLLTPLLR